MADKVVKLDDYRKHAREALIDYMSQFASSEYELSEVGEFVDSLVGTLWMAGYKIVRLEEKDAPKPPLHA